MDDANFVSSFGDGLIMAAFLTVCFGTLLCQGILIARAINTPLVILKSFKIMAGDFCERVRNFFTFEISKQADWSMMALANHAPACKERARP
jgi:hypothetical protein